MTEEQNRKCPLDTWDRDVVANAHSGESSADLNSPNDSLNNKFWPYYSEGAHDLGQEVLQHVVEEVLWTEGGEYIGSASECEVPKRGPGYDIGKRIAYWQSYLKQHAKITKKLAQATGKDPCDLLLNRGEEYRKIQQCKRIMDVAERLSPTHLICRQPIKSKEIPCVPDTYETLPAIERRKQPMLTLTEMPKCALEEQGLCRVEAKKSSWLKSEYLGEKLVDTKDTLKNVLSHYPDAENLQVVGIKLLPHDPKKKDDVEETDSKHIEFQVIGAWYRTREPTLEYVISIEDKQLDAEDKRKNNLNFWLTFECAPFEHQTRTFTIRNKGWKAVDVEWVRMQHKRMRCLPRLGAVYPTFYFNKNHARVQPGNVDVIEFIFCSREFGIFEECWEIKLVPSFLADKFKITVSLFGHCRQEELDRKEFFNIENTLNRKAGKHIADDILHEVATYATQESPPQIPYSMHFTDKELFSIVNPNLNYNEDCVEQLKDIYVELVQNDYYTACKEWQFNLKKLKNAILEIPDEMKRKETYAKYKHLVSEMKANPAVFGPNYGDQKFLLVRNVLLSMADNIERIVYKLEDSIYETQYDLSFDEVLVTNANVVNGATSDGDGKIQDDSKSVCVVKSEHIRKKKEQIFQESLYIQTYGQICRAVDQMVCVVEGMSRLL